MTRSSDLLPAIVVSTHTTGLAVIRSLGRRGVPVVAMSYDDADIGAVSRFVHRRIPVAHPERDERAFLRTLEQHAPSLAGGLVMACSDAALATVARHKTELSRHYVVACPDWGIVERFLDKKYTYEFAAAVGVPAPTSALLRDDADVERWSAEVQYPCLVKPSQGHRYFDRFRVKMARVHSPDELRAAFREAAEAGLEVLLQEWIPGPDSLGVNYNAYFWDGRPLVEFTAQKVANAPPELGSPCVVYSKVLPEAIAVGRSLLQAARFSGFACTEFKRDPRDGSYKLMEVNARHNLSASLAARCGVDFPWLQYQHLMQGIRPVARVYEEDVHWIDPTRHWKASWSEWRAGRLSVRAFLTPYLSSHVLADLVWTDPRPFVRRLRNLVRKQGRRMLAAASGLRSRPSTARPPRRPVIDA